MKKFFTLGLIFVCLLSVTGLYAAQRSHDEMVAIARQTLTKSLFKTQSDTSGNLQEAATPSVEAVTSSSSYSVFNSDRGFVLVSTDDRFPEVLGYGFDDKFDPTDMPPALVELLESYDRELRVLDSISAIEPVVLKEAITFTDAVDPLIKTQWGQGTPFNDSTPKMSVCNVTNCQTVTGCVATAMAQVMKYYKHPTKGSGSYGYTIKTHTYNCGGSESTSSYTPAQPYVNYGATMYQYDKMLDSYSGIYSPDAGSAVAQLMYHCGVSVDMGYGCLNTGGSESSYDDAVVALKTYFDYDPNYQRLIPELFEPDSLAVLIHDELKAGRPVFVRGSDVSKGGHAFIADGCDTEGLFHINWGWEGTDDAYYSLSALKPVSQSYNFTKDIRFYIGIQPNTYGTSKSPYPQICDSLYFPNACTGSDKILSFGWIFRNRGLYDLEGTYAVALFNESGTKIKEGIIDNTTMGAQSRFGGGYNFNLSGVPNGTYLLRTSYTTTDYTINHIPVMNGQIIAGDNYVTLEISNSSVCVVPNKEPELEGLSLTKALSLPNALNQNRSGDALTFSVQNSGDAAINGTIQARILSAPNGDSIDTYGTTTFSIGIGATQQGSIQGTYGEKIKDNTQYSMSLYWRENASQAWQKLTPDGFNSISFKISASSTESDTTEIYDTMCQSNIGVYRGGDWRIILEGWFEPGETTKDTVHNFGQDGNDSIVHLHLTLLPSYTITKYDTICKGDNILVNGVPFAPQNDTYYMEELYTTTGCDSTITHYVTVNPTYSITVYDTISQGETFSVNGTAYDVPGTYTITENAQTTKGCDSIVTHKLTVNQVYSNVVYDTLCQGETYALTGTAYNTAGSYTYLETLKTTLGGDSTVNHRITVNPIYNIDKFDTICQGSTFALNSITYNTPGTFTYTENLTTVKGCDSVVTHHLTVNPIYNIDAYDTICPSGSLIVNGISYNTPGTYTENLTTSTGCDSIVNHHLAVSDIFPITRNDTICKGESITISGHTYTTAGSYTDTIHATEGCDTILRLTLTVLGDTTTIPVNIDLATATLPYVVDNYYTVPANTTSDTIVYVATERCLYNKYDVKIKQATPILTPTDDVIKVEVVDCLGRIIRTYGSPILTTNINLPIGVYIVRQFYANGVVKIYRTCVK